MPLKGKTDPAALSAAFALVFRKGRSPPSCPVPDDTDLLNRIRDAVPPRISRQTAAKRSSGSAASRSMLSEAVQGIPCRRIRDRGMMHGQLPLRILRRKIPGFPTPNTRQHFPLA